MDNIEKLTGNYVHDLFCEMMDCEKIGKEYLSIETLEDIDYFAKLKEEEIYDDGIVSQYKQNEDGSVSMYVNKDLLNMQPYHSIDTILSQLFDLYAGSGALPFYEPAYQEAHRFSFLKSPQEGYRYWFEFSCSFMSMKLLRQAFEGVDTGENKSDEELVEKYKEILKELPNSEEDKDIKISTIIYLFGKLAYMDSVSNTEVKSLLQIRKLELFDLSEIIEGELGNAINNAYKMFAKSILVPLKIYDYIKAAKLIRKIDALLP